MFDVTKDPSYHLYEFTLKLYENRIYLYKLHSETRPIRSMIINRAYYSTYSYVTFWLKDEGERFITHTEYKARNKDIIPEHTQILQKLQKRNKFKIKSKLYELKKLRQKADYNLTEDITEKEMDNAIIIMKHIFNKIKIE